MGNRIAGSVCAARPRQYGTGKATPTIRPALPATHQERALREGFMLAPGNAFRPHLEPTPWMRFNVAVCDTIE
jgi:hypothetical protein